MAKLPVSLSKSILTYAYIWAFCNILAGIWEIYAFINRDKLKIEKMTLWEKMAIPGKITLSNFWIEGWSEYCKVDSRYIYRQYVWFFELLNALIAPLFLIALLLNDIPVILFLLLVSIINCIFYFITLFIDSILCENITKYAKMWMFIIYYMISGIWLIIPSFLYLSLIN